MKRVKLIGIALLILAAVACGGSSSGPGNTPPPMSAEITVTPAAVTISAGQQQTFAATVGSQPTVPLWSLDCQSRMPGDCGIISASGVYTAPLSPPPGGTVSITATRSDNAAISSKASVLIQFGNGSLKGTYAYSLNTFKVPGDLDYSQGKQIGTVTFDGAGKITGGGYSVGGMYGGPEVMPIDGTYQVGSDGRGIASVASNPPWYDRGPPETWHFALVSHTRGDLVRYSAALFGGLAFGTFELQDPTQFNSASIAGRYAMSVLGGRTRYAPTSAKPPQAGSIVLDANGNITSGTICSLEPVYNATLSVTGGGYEWLNAGGHGYMWINSGSGPPMITIGEHYLFQVVNGSHVLLAETPYDVDESVWFIGDLFRQADGPFTNSSFNGRYTFTAYGTSGLTPVVAVGSFFMDGLGGVSDGVLDANVGGISVNTAFIGAYNVTDSSTGRAQISLTTPDIMANLVAFPQGDGSLVLCQGEGTNLLLASAIQQKLDPADSMRPIGHFASMMNGTDFEANGDEVASGNLIFSGGSSFIGTLDINDYGAITPAATLVGNALTVDATTGRGTAAVQSSDGTFGGTLIMYRADANTLLLMLGDSQRALAGTAGKQY